MEKLSSGFRINRAGDDAAGLAISEKMRGQIRGLNQASSNAQDGISLIQTAEGALNETHAILQRMRELSVQAASDTNVEADRGEIQKELTQLTEEIDRIATTTEFNTMKLVNGDRAVERAKKDVAVDKTYGVSAALGITGDLKGIGDITLTDTADFKWSDIDSTAGANKITITKAAEGLSVSIAGLEKGVANKITVTDAFLTVNEDGSHSYDAHGVSFTVSKEDFAAMTDGYDMVIDVGTNVTGDATSTATADATAAALKTDNSWATHDGTATIAAGVVVDGSKMIDGAKSVKIEGNSTGLEFKVTIFGGADGTTALSEDVITKVAAATGFKYNNHGVSFEIAGKTNHATDGALEMTIDLDTEKVDGAVLEDKSLKFQVGANEDQSISLSIEDMGSKALAIDTIAVNDHDAAKAAVTTINDAIEKVSGERSKLGAIQNRLEHTIKNLDTSSENLQASESRIRDVDMAKEMMEQTKQNILAQASTAMLAQANASPEAVLQLLR